MSELDIDVNDELDFYEILYNKLKFIILTSVDQISLDKLTEGNSSLDEKKKKKYSRLFPKTKNKN